MHFLFFLVLLSPMVLAQHSEQPKKEDTIDHRHQTTLFRVEDVKAGKVFLLERGSSSDHFLKLKKGTDEESIKLDSRLAKKIDMDFASRFIRCQYELPAAEGECDVTLRLNMKGENQDICSKDDKKSQEIAVFMEELQKRF